jgi:glycosyltransferase 2 family protein
MTSSELNLQITKTSLRQGPKASRAWWVISFVVSATLLFLALRGVDWEKVGSAIRGADLVRLLAGVSVLSFAFFLRAVRWRVVLTAEPPLPVSTVFWANMLGYAANNLLPARAGELVRSIVIASRSELTKSFVLTTALTERTIDALTLVLISTLALGMLPGTPSWLTRARLGISVVAVAGILGILLVGHIDSMLARIVAALPINRDLRTRIQQVQTSFIAALLAFRHRRRALMFSGMTLIIWGCDTAVALLVASALHLPLHPTGAVILIAALGLSSALPSTPGYVGVYQFVAVSVLVPFGFSRSEALAFILLFQLNIYLVVCSWAALGMWRLQAEESAASIASADESAAEKEVSKTR